MIFCIVVIIIIIDEKKEKEKQDFLPKTTAPTALTAKVNVMYALHFFYLVW